MGGHRPPLQWERRRHACLYSGWDRAS